MANLGVIAAPCRAAAIRSFEDRLNHASLIDGALLARARPCAVIPMADAAAGARAALSRRPGRPTGRLIATDGVFSMDGDLAPLPALAAIARQAGAWLLVDDAHGLGVLGREGRGSLDHFGLDAAAVPILMGTLGKALGTFGAFVAGSAGPDRDPDPARPPLHLHHGPAAGPGGGDPGQPGPGPAGGVAAGASAGH